MWRFRYPPCRLGLTHGCPRLSSAQGMLDLLTSSGNHRSERGLVRRIRYLLFKLTLAHARTMVAHSACCICPPAQVSIHRNARIGMALPRPAKLAYHVFARARTLVVHSACSTCSLAQLTTAVLGLVRRFHYLLCQPVSLALCACPRFGSA